MQLLLFFVIYESSCIPLGNIFLCMDEFKADAKWSEWMYGKFLINTLVNNKIFRYIYVRSTQKFSDFENNLLLFWLINWIILILLVFYAALPFLNFTSKSFYTVYTNITSYTNLIIKLSHNDMKLREFGIIKLIRYTFTFYNMHFKI